MIELRECIEKLGGDDEADRIYAAEDIGCANRAEGVPPLLARLPAEPSRAVREAIFAALLQIEDDAVTEGALELLDSEDSYLRNQAVEVLRARGARAIPRLDRAFLEGSADRRKFVIDVLATSGDPAAAGIYDRALADADPNVVITAVESLGARRVVAFRARIESLMVPGAHPMLLCAAIEALAQIGDEGSVTAIRQCIGGGAAMPGFLQASYVKLLGAKGCPDDVHEIARLIGREGLEGPVLNALAALRSRFREMELPLSLAGPLEKIASDRACPHLAYQAVRALAGLLQIEEVFAFVKGCLEDSEKVIRIAAVQAMREGASSRGEGILQDRLARETDEEVLQALRR
jgi:HEAT repeat protein